jgi:large subunit ribosomal protein L30
MTEEKVKEQKQEDAPKLSSDKTSPSKTLPNKLAVVLVRGLAGVEKHVKDTLMMLKLSRKNRCVVVSVDLKGMLLKAKDYITWGEISDETFTKLVEKRGVEFKGRLEDRKKKYTYKTLEVKGKKYLPYFNLNPPKKGFGRKGIKAQFKTGGALGYRSDKMNDLLERMI